MRVTVPKPTQVGRVSILRRSRELLLRNSAKCIRNFGRRMARSGQALASFSWIGLQRNGPGDCLSKTYVSAKSQDDV